MKTTFSNFTKLYKPTSKTLRFTLIPQGKTEENIAKSKTLELDVSRSISYNAVKSTLDEVHKRFIEESMSKAQFGWKELYEAHEEYSRTTDESALKTAREKQIKAVVAYLGKAKKDFELEPAKIIKKI